MPLSPSALPEIRKTPNPKERELFALAIERIDAGVESHAREHPWKGGTLTFRFFLPEKASNAVCRRLRNAYRKAGWMNVRIFRDDYPGTRYVCCLTHWTLEQKRAAWKKTSWLPKELKRRKHNVRSSIKKGTLKEEPRLFCVLFVDYGPESKKAYRAMRASGIPFSVTTYEDSPDREDRVAPQLYTPYGAVARLDGVTAAISLYKDKWSRQNRAAG